MDIHNIEQAPAFTTKDGSIIRELLAHRNSGIQHQSLAEARVPPGATTTPHYHARTEEIYYLLSGTANMTIGEETASTLIDSMGHEGKIAMYGSTGGRMVTFSLNIGAKNIQLLSMSIDTSDRYVPETVPSFRDEALAKFNDGTFKPIIDTVLPVSEVAKAHEMVGNRKHFGKIILSIPH